MATTIKHRNGNESFRLSKGKVTELFVVNRKTGKGAYQRTFKGSMWDRNDPMQANFTTTLVQARKHYRKLLDEGFKPDSVQNY